MQEPPAKIVFFGEGDRKMYELERDLQKIRQEHFKHIIQSAELQLQQTLLENKELAIDRELARVKAKVLQLT